MGYQNIKSKYMKNNFEIKKSRISVKHSNICLEDRIAQIIFPE